MHFPLSFAVALFAIGSQALPAIQSDPSPLAGTLLKRQSRNSPTNRAAWDGTHDINTDYRVIWPNGVVREYWLTLENSTFAPDGYKRTMLTFNGTYPGPTLIANWGDTLRIHVKNNLADNGTSVHWHGIRQLLTVEQDGVNGVTQCPIAPGDSLTYEWKATQYGSSWYHSHFTVQYADGLVGAIVINGPTSANYDEDLGPIFLTDWYHETAFTLQARGGAVPPAQNGLINGKNVLDCTGSTDTNCVGGGQRFQFPRFVAGRKYKLRLVNVGTDTQFRVSLDGHTMTVVAADFVPVTPFNTSSLFLGIGQRYDVIIEANAAPGSYWFRATSISSCSAANPQADNIMGIVRYAAVTNSGDPTSTPVTMPNDCLDESLDLFAPIVKHDVPKTDLSTAQDVSVGINAAVRKWTLNGISLQIDWSDPTLLLFMEDQIYPTDYNVLTLPTANQWYYLVIETTLPVTHPIHLHGHDSAILAQGTGVFDASTAKIHWNNPLRRDVAMLPASGYLVIAFLTDNPGIWLMHCHIAWHVANGFALQFIERPSDIPTAITIDPSWNQTCNAWDTYDASVGNLPMPDSGLRRPDSGLRRF